MASPRNYQRERLLAKARGETGVGTMSGDAQRHRARRRREKVVGKPLKPDDKKPKNKVPDNLAIKPMKVGKKKKGGRK